MDRFSRTINLIGDENFNKLTSKKVLLFGLGGVGGYVAEALVRTGVGAIDVLDGDSIARSNINRELLALDSTVGQFKTSVFSDRAKQINPNVLVTEYPIFYSESNADVIDFSNYDYIIDAIDTVTSKLIIITKAKSLGVPVLSCMGTGNKLDATAFKIADIKNTNYCPLARVMRRELKKRNIESGVKVLYSEEQPVKPTEGEVKGNGIAPASIAFVPSVVGLLIAGEVVKDLIK